VITLGATADLVPALEGAVGFATAGVGAAFGPEEEERGAALPAAGAAADVGAARAAGAGAEAEAEAGAEAGAEADAEAGAGAARAAGGAFADRAVALARAAC